MFPSPANPSNPIGGAVEADARAGLSAQTATPSAGASVTQAPSPLGSAPHPGAADVVILAASLGLMLWNLGAYGLYEPHEGHFGGAGREMALSGDWLVPHLNGSPYLNKPPLLYWSIAFCSLVGGVSEWATRLPAAVYGWCGVLLAWHWASLLWGLQAGRLAAAMLTVTAGWFLFTHQSMIDVPLSVLFLCTLYFFWRGACEPRRRIWWLCFYGSMALGFMAKGFGGLIFPALVAGSFVFLRRRWDLVRAARLWWGVPLTFFPVTLWALWVESRCPGFLDHIIVNEHLRRAVDTRWPKDYGVSQVGVWGYLGVTAVWCAPWILATFPAARFAWRQSCSPAPLAPGASGPAPEARAQAAPGAPAGSTGGRKPEPAISDAVLILALGALWPVLFFLPIPSRLIYYCLPTVPPFVLLVAGWWLHGGAGEGQPHSARRGMALVFLGAGAAVFSVAFWIAPCVEGIPDLQAAPATLLLLPALAALCGAGLLLGGFFLWQGRPRAAACYLCGLLGAAALRAVAGFTSYEDVRSSKRLVAELDPKLGPQAVWVAEGSNELGASAGIAFYLGADALGRARTVRVMIDDSRRPQPEFGQVERAYALKRAELRDLWASPRPVVFVTDLMRRSDALDEEPLYYQDEQKNWVRGIRMLGEPLPEKYGFRRVYANAAARERLVERGAWSVERGE